MKKCLLVFLVTMIAVIGKSQISIADSMKLALLDADNDSTRFYLLAKLGTYYVEVKTDSALYFFQSAQSVALQNNKKLSAAYALDGIGYSLNKLSAYGQSLEAFNEGFSYANDPQNKKAAWKFKKEMSETSYILTYLHMDFGHLLGATNSTDQQLIHYQESMKLAYANNDFESQSLLNASIGKMYAASDKTDSALMMFRSALKISEDVGNKKYVSVFYKDIGKLYLENEKYDSASFYLHLAEQIATEFGNPAGLLEVHKELTGYFLEKERKDSSLYYAQLSLEDVNSTDKEANLGHIYENLFKAYALNNQLDSAYKYQGLALTFKDIQNNQKIKVLSEFQNLNLAEKLKIRELENEKVLDQGRIRTYALLAGTAVILLLAFIFYRNSRQKQKAHDIIKKAYGELKETQKQLVQSEKMASLGELTAGIAHEIQNPLNFVKNFSEVNTELADELIQTVEKGDIEEIKNLAADIRANQEKIKYHGERADSIVKSMLQHSRTSTGQKEPTDINQLCDEYSRLAFHGMRAKDKNFNAEIKTHLSQILVPVSVIPQDIGRVILNLINNALYAVDQKSKRGLPAYKPEVLLTTSRSGNFIEIKIKDNGDGISDTLKEKIFQPFFTTKPTGEGTGLGLSLSYDIVTKGHGGDLRMDSREGIGTTFTIVLPIQ